jgi:hypothetical protein
MECTNYRLYCYIFIYSVKQYSPIIMVKVVPQHAKQAQRGSNDTAQHILDPSARMGWAANAMPWPLYPWETDLVPIV